MNIFWLDNNPDVCAKYHNNRHVVKMILELAQLMCTAHHEHGTNTPLMYKPTHKNHPCAVWVRESGANYNECMSLFLSLCNEYTYRYGKVHSCYRLVDALWAPPECIQGMPATPKPLAMPDKYKRGCPIESYREYYINDKYQLASWSKRPDPPWWRWVI